MKVAHQLSWIVEFARRTMFELAPLPITGVLMGRLTELQTLIASDRARMRVLHFVRSLGLPDCWVAAGFVRSCVWDHVHQRATSHLPQDIDVIWYDSEQPTPGLDALLELALRGQDDTIRWSVKNQARMHQRNADSPYQSATDAMRYWPETATAIGVRLDQHGVIEIAAPFGLDDLFELIVRPTERFVNEKHRIYLDRIRSKSWQATWPRLSIQMVPHGQNRSLPNGSGGNRPQRSHAFLQHTRSDRELELAFPNLKATAPA
jgi:hypothetical protein